MNVLKPTVECLAKDLAELCIPFSVIGALAVGARGRARQTVDADFAIAVSEDRKARQLVDQLVLRGYGVSNLYENEFTKKLGLAKLFAPSTESQLIELDLLFDFCGIEAEVVSGAEPLEIWPGVTVPVASMPALLAMKARCQELPERIQDRADLVNQLLPYSSAQDVEEARSLIMLIQKRGYNEGRNLIDAFDNLVKQHGRT